MKTKPNKTLALLLCLALITAVLSACGGAASSAAPASEPAPAASAPASTAQPASEPAAGGAGADIEPTNVVVWVGDWWAPEKEHLEAAFAEQNPGWTLELVLQPVAGYLDSAIAAVANGSGPDVLDLDTLMIPSAIDAGLVTPLDDFMSRYGITADQFVKANYDAGVADGVNYSIPNRNAPIALFYNKTMFDAAGVDYPTNDMTVEGFREMAKELTTNDTYGFGIAAAKTDGANVMTSVGPFLWGAGGDFLNEDMSAAAINTPESVAGIKAWVEMYTVDKSVPEGCIDYSITRDLLPLAQTQNIAMFPLNDNNMSTFIAGQEDGSIDAFEWGMSMLPGPGRAAGWSFTIPTGTAKTEAAEFFINWYIQPEVISTNNTCMPAVIEGLSLGKYGDENLAVFYEQMNNLQNCPAHPKWSDMQVAVIEELQNALAGTITPEEACAAMEARINDLLAA